MINEKAIIAKKDLRPFAATPPHARYFPILHKVGVTPDSKQQERREEATIERTLLFKLQQSAKGETASSRSEEKKLQSKELSSSNSSNLRKERQQAAGAKRRSYNRKSSPLQTTAVATSLNMDASGEPVRVFVRVRPEVSATASQTSCVSLVDQTSLKLIPRVKGSLDDKMYSFDRVFPGTCDQENLWESVSGR